MFEALAKAKGSFSRKRELSPAELQVREVHQDFNSRQVHIKTRVVTNSFSDESPITKEVSASVTQLRGDWESMTPRADQGVSRGFNRDT